MTVALQLPEFITAKLESAGRGLEDETLQTLVCGLYREGRVSAVEAMRALGIDSRLAFETLVAVHHAERDWCDAEIDSELDTIRRLNA